MELVDFCTLWIFSSFKTTGLFQPVYSSVYLRCVRYSEEEKEQLKRYHAIHGNNWKKISGLMNRSNLSVALKYSQMKARKSALKLKIQALHVRN